MGSRMAGRLLDAGYPLGVYNRTRERREPLRARGASVYDSPRALAQHADVVLSSLTDDAAVEAALLGPEGALAGARAGATFIDLSSIYPETSRRVAAAAERQGAALLDAPVSGSAPQAEAGQLVIFVGGDEGVYERHQPLFEVLGQTRFYLGPSGAGTTMKLVANALLGVGVQALAEAITLGERAGLDRNALLDVLAQTAVIAPTHRSKLANARTETYPVAFALRLMWKDYGNILRLAQGCAVPMPVTAAAQQVMAVEAARAVEEDYSAVIRTTEELAGVLVPVPGR
jgi:3-hydroxyisobutyrate dehydrogenase-like beta-hydroxyacid dehydrogenase